MLELMLNISDYQAWLKSMLALAERREEMPRVEVERPESVTGDVEDSDDLDMMKSNRGKAAELASSIGTRLAGDCGVPVFFYGAAREDVLIRFGLHAEDLRPLAQLRRSLGYFSGAAKGEWSGLSEDIKKAIVQLPPDRGPIRQVDDRYGVAVVGAVPWVHNYNLLIMADLDQAELMTRCRRIAKGVSQRGGGLKDVESMALPHEKGVEVACNLLDASVSPPAQVPPTQGKS
eukprot:symbB.v1.2.020137.t1/scaffold1677.1/size106310/4